MARQGILLDEEGDLLIRNGSFVIGPTDAQDMATLIKMHPGEQRLEPELGVGASSYLKKPGYERAGFARRVNLMLRRDGYDNARLDLSRGLENFSVEVDE